MYKEKIGHVKVEYSETGEVTSSEFVPHIKTDFKIIKEQLQSIKVGDTAVIKANADMVMAGWFSKVNDIELIDRNEKEIVSEIQHCKMYPNGLVKLCVIAYYLVNVQG